MLGNLELWGNGCEDAPERSSEPRASELQLGCRTLYHLNCQKNKCDWNACFHWKYGWQNRALPWTVETMTNEMLVGPSIYFICEVFANPGTALVVLECHTASSTGTPFCLTPFHLSYTVSTFPSNDPIRRLSTSEKARIQIG